MDDSYCVFPEEIMLQIVQSARGLEYVMFRRTCKQFSTLPDAETRKEPVIRVAAKHGYLNILKEFPTLNPEQCNIICTLAAKHGHLDIFKWKSESLGDGVFRQAALAGHLDILKWAFSKRKSCPDVSTYAAEAGSLDIIKFLISRKQKIHEHCCLLAAEHGHFELLKYLIENRIVLLHPNTCDSAAEGGQAERSGPFSTGEHLEIIKWVEQKQGIKFTETTLTRAFSGGNLEMIKYISNTVPIMYRMLDFAAAKGHLHILKWLVETYPALTIKQDITDSLSSYTCTIEMLELLADRGIRFSPKFFNKLIPRWDIIDWAESQGYPLDLNNNNIIRRKILKDNGYTGDYGIITLESVKILAANGYEITAGLVTSAVQTGKLSVVKWLLENNYPYNSDIKDFASFRGHNEMYNWLCAHGY